MRRRCGGTATEERRKCDGSATEVRRRSEVRRKCDGDAAERRRCDGGATEVRRKCDGSATEMRRSGGGATEVRRKCDGSATEMPRSGRRRGRGATEVRRKQNIQQNHTKTKTQQKLNTHPMQANSQNVATHNDYLFPSPKTMSWINCTNSKNACTQTRIAEAFSTCSQTEYIRKIIAHRTRHL